jgi:uncharacterized protein YndB with AHSA1/START domain
VPDHLAHRPSATLHDDGPRAVLRLRRRLRHSPEKVFRAISDPDELRHWFPALVDTDHVVGHPVRFSFPGQPDVDGGSGTVLVHEPPRVFAYTWYDDVLRWEITPDGKGCVLTLTQTNHDRLAAARHATGWHACLLGLAARLDGAPEPSWTPRDSYELAAAHVAEFGLDRGELLADGTVRFERDFTTPREELWEALVDGHDLVVGAAPPPRCAPEGVTTGVLTAVEPGELIEHGAVRLHLRDAPVHGTRLTLTCTGPADAPAALAAWHAHLERLFALVQDQRADQPEGHLRALRERYAAATAGA